MSHADPTPQGRRAPVRPASASPRAGGWAGGGRGWRTCRVHDLPVSGRGAGGEDRRAGDGILGCYSNLRRLYIFVSAFLV